MFGYDFKAAEVENQSLPSLLPSWADELYLPEAAGYDVPMVDFCSFYSLELNSVA